MTKTEEQIQTEAFHAGEALANPVLKTILSELEMESLEALAKVDAANTAAVYGAQADVKSVRKLYTRLVNKVQALKNRQAAEERKEASPMGNNL